MIPFSAGDVQKQARALAAEKFVRPRIDLPKQLQDMGFEPYRETERNFVVRKTL